ncbi:MAG: FAD-dependent oxidoreductase [Bifidobacterium sp.]|uniref:L-aspartate oxidase n=1 Tax=Bifidobacterium sp. TaxID=41200 RepID=UPI0039E962DE
MIVVVGAGIAGISAALAIAGGSGETELDSGQPGQDVLLISKTSFTMSNTFCAQGGIAAAVADDDSPEMHAHDTLIAGDGLCDREAVAILTTEGAREVKALARNLVHFDRDASGQLQHGMEGAHGVARILHAGGDATGYVMENDLASVAALNPRIHILEHAFLESLRARDGEIEGLRVHIDLDAEMSAMLRKVYETRADDEVVHELRARAGSDGDGAVEIAARSVILATGGAGQAYEYTTNPEIATGDGVAAAWRVGARIQDAEFYQFHPTALAAKKHFLVSEAVRGEGAVLLDSAGERYMPDIDSRAELAPRDIVARANFRTMQRQGGDPVRLDVTVLADRHQDLAAFLKRRFPTLDHFTKKEGLDWATSPIPVTPAAHYWMGGIHTDLWGRTTVPGLYAAGECARTGVHGANRLASNSLLEGLVFGRRAGIAAVMDAAASRADGSPVDDNGVDDSGVNSNRVDAVRLFPDGTLHISGHIPTREEIQRLMWTNVGVIRRESDLKQAVHTLFEWLQTMDAVYAHRLASDVQRGGGAKGQGETLGDGKPESPSQFEESKASSATTFMENRNLVTVGYLIAKAALNRPESLGAHARE